MLHQIAIHDHWLMRRINGWRPPRWVRVWMLAATRLGDGWLWYGMCFSILLFGGAERFLALGAACSAAAVGSFVFKVVKRKTGRRRPCDIAPHCWATLLPPDQFSFPSGHSINAFSFAIAFGLFYPSLMPVMLFCAFSIAISRVLLGMHFLSDVVAGSGLGALLGFCSYVLYR
jgi:undecaprenyl-diphosphatase